MNPKEIITEIKEYVGDAFDQMNIIGCDSEGLYHYLQYGNDDFKHKERVMCYDYLFLKEAEKRGVITSSSRKRAGKEAERLLDLNYPQYYSAVKEV